MAGYTSSSMMVEVTTSADNVSISIGSTTTTDAGPEGPRPRVSTAWRAAAFRFFVAAAF
jgi:hypothetical protein